jgi:hypothetical protein
MAWRAGAKPANVAFLVGAKTLVDEAPMVVAGCQSIDFDIGL